MKGLRWVVAFGAGLVAFSAGLYLAHCAVFRNAYHSFLCLLGDIAFLPLGVLLISLVLHGLRTRCEKRLLLAKLNVAIGVFFSEIGTGLLTLFATCTPDALELRSSLSPGGTGRGRGSRRHARA